MGWNLSHLARADLLQNRLRLSLGGERGRFLLRGYKADAFRGSQIVSAGAEYRFPLLSIWRSLGLQPAILREVHAHIFADVGAAGDALSFSNLKASIGMELRLWASFWGLGPNFRFGVAQGLDQPRFVFYFDIGLATAF